MNTTNKPLPKMTVEKRISRTPHRVPKPLTDKELIAEQIQDTLQLNNDAKIYEVRELLYKEIDDKLAPLAWKPSTLNILKKHIGVFFPDITDEEIISISKDVLKVNGFDELSRWVQDDMCSEVFNRMLRYCINDEQTHTIEKGFIDGSGIGYLSLFIKNLKINIEKTFDAKYYYKGERPLKYILDVYGMDLTLMANEIHPGHYTYPQGHSTKSLTAVQTLAQVFKLDPTCYRKLLIAAFLFGHGRDGNLIHKPEDTYAAGFNTTLKEFN